MKIISYKRIFKKQIKQFKSEKIDSQILKNWLDKKSHLELTNGILPLKKAIKKAQKNAWGILKLEGEKLDSQARLNGWEVVR